jgi:hypothetical protein
MFAVSIGVVVARYRDRAQRQTRRLWEDRSAAQVEFEQRSAQVRAATRLTPGHDFKKTLAVLASFGSSSARAAALEQGEHPGLLIGYDDSGTTLRDAAEWTWIDPADAGCLWLSREQADELSTFMDLAEEGATTDDAATLLVTAAHGSTLGLRYLGREIVLEHPPPVFQALIDPGAVSLIVGGVIKLWSVTAGDFRGTRRALPTIAGLFDIAAAGYFLLRPPDADQYVRVIACSALSSLSFCQPVVRGAARATTPAGSSVFPATGGLGSMILVCERYRHQLGAWRYPLRALIATVWLAAALAHEGRPLFDLINEAPTLFLGPLATTGIDERIRYEASVLEHELRDEFARRVEGARRDAVDHELRRFEDQLQLAERELATLSATIPQDLRDVLEQDCENLRRWLRDPMARETLAR